MNEGRSALGCGARLLGRRNIIGEMWQALHRLPLNAPMVDAAQTKNVHLDNFYR